jgi:glycerol-3-phosphate cytidylyltransferase
MKIGFACGVFDLYHTGHVLMLKECRENCDYLIVALNTAQNLSQDKNPPIYSIEERKLIMSSCRYVDQVVSYNSEEELLEILKTSKIDIRFLGDDYKIKPITGPDLKMEFYFINRDHGYSTSSLIQKIAKRHS